MRTLILLCLLALAACSTSNASKLDPAARNLVCERIAVLNAKATCTPEFTDAGDAHIHTARVSFQVKGDDGKPVTVVQACGIAAAQASMVCGDLLAQAAKAEGQPKP